MYFEQAFSLILLIIASLITALAIYQLEKGRFFEDTQYLAFFGIYVWGDALIFGPFWIISAIIFFAIGIQNIIRYILLFFAIRAYFEVIYWLNHQAHDQQFQAPLFKRFKKIKARESAILYQLLNSITFFFCLISLIATFI